MGILQIISFFVLSVALAQGNNNAKQMYFAPPALPYGPSTHLVPFYCRISAGQSGSNCPAPPPPMDRCDWTQPSGNCAMPVAPCPDHCLICPSSCLIAGQSGATCPTECGVCC